MTKFTHLLAASAFAALATPALAAGVTVDGDTDIRVETENSAAIGIGENVFTAVGSLNACNVDFGGDFSADIRTRNSAAIAIGTGNTATVGSANLGDGDCVRN